MPLLAQAGSEHGSLLPYPNEWSGIAGLDRRGGHAERRRVARGAAGGLEWFAPEKVLLAGVGRESVIETLRLAEYAAQVEYDAILVRTPHYYRKQMRNREMLTYYQAVADRSPLPVLLYSVPSCTAYDLPIEVVAELAMHPNIVGHEGLKRKRRADRRAGQSHAHSQKADGPGNPCLCGSYVEDALPQGGSAGRQCRGDFSYPQVSLFPAPRRWPRHHPGLH